MFMPTLRCECAQPASDRLMRKWCIDCITVHSFSRMNVTSLLFDRVQICAVLFAGKYECKKQDAIEILTCR